ncbi:hypothetical protein RKD29_007629 [Streptomyces tendae]
MPSGTGPPRTQPLPSERTQLHDRHDTPGTACRIAAATRKGAVRHAPLLTMLGT